MTGDLIDAYAYPPRGLDLATAARYGSTNVPVPVPAGVGQSSADTQLTQ